MADPRSANVRATLPGATSDASRNSEPSAVATLTVVAGPDLGTRVVLEKEVSIGRDPEADLCLNDPGVSWRHTRVESRDNRWALCDEASTNGTVCHGSRVREVALDSGDKFALGATLVRFDLQDSIDRAYDAISQCLKIDDLGGLYSARRFQSTFRRWVERSRESGEPIALLVMDLDGIKAINDRWGHAFGAYTIAEAGQIIGRVLGERGMACRWGGDEFVAALPGRDGPSAEGVAEEICSAITAKRFQHEKVSIRCGISIGVAALSEEAGDADALFRSADEALYRAKRAGKGRVRC